MADVLMGVTETAATGQNSVSGLMQSYLYEKSRLLPSITDYSYLVQPGDKSLSIGRSSSFTVETKAENTAVSAQALTLAGDTITLENHRVIQFLLEDIASEQSKVAVIERALMQAAADLAVDIDTYIIAELVKASVSSPDHNIVFEATTTDIITLADILAARSLLQAQHVNVDECSILVGPEKEAEMLAIDSFIKTNEWGNSDPIQNGVIGKIYGMAVRIHSGATDRMFTYHPSAVGFAQQMASVESARDLANMGTRVSASVLHGVEVLDEGKRQVFTDSTN